eukprot:TRINITY_DN1157_c0_g1_i2.p2 TRINITY_DN1157_c0_g1~~TRINITY_DN1157_c0_g1_i2.p2  ORF type:complete len:389 (-),score=86.19 TRINITY_DN1157_c0_g1_i2:34-1200(-)
MGIHKLMNLILEKAKNAVKNISLDSLTGRIIACDASTAIYQFLVSNLSMKEGFGIETLKDPKGNPTAHLIGIFNRTIQFLSHGIKPVWVFDGKPPEKKKEELHRRHLLKTGAEEEKKLAEEEGDLVEARKMAGRSVKVTPEMTADAKKMVQLMGLPIVEASSEAEAQCAVMCREGRVYATATEDMDALTFGTKILLRGFNSKKEPITEIHLDTVLKEFGMTMDTFIDLCIMCGCDYTTTIDGIGPVKAFKYVASCKTMEAALEKIDSEYSKSTKKKKYTLPPDFDYVTARTLFKAPEVIDPSTIELKFGKPDEIKLKQFLIEEKGFNDLRVDSGLKKILKSQSQGTQARLDTFYAVSYTHLTLPTILLVQISVVAVSLKKKITFKQLY